MSKLNMQCQKYKICQSKFHNDCHQVMELYFKMKYNGDIFYLCPDCQIAEKIPYEEFYEKHKIHLKSFKTS